MSSQLESLSDDEIHKITLLIEALERSTFDFLQLQVGNIKLTIGTGSPPTAEKGTTGATIALAPQRQTAPDEQLPTAQSPAIFAGSSDKNKDSADEGILTVRAPIMGRFYDKPDPGAAPFVRVGSIIKENTTVCLIEVMKLFQSVRAGVSGVITEICVKDTEMVENGQILFRVRPR